MGFVHPDHDDLFVSYAHVDDEPEPEVEVGWVTSLTRSIKRELARKLGRVDSASIWTDHLLATNALVTPEIEDRVRQAAILLMVLSPGYLASHWCNAELKSFFESEARRRKGNTSGVFIVEYDRVDRPAELADLLATKFWKADPDNVNITRTLGFPKVDPADGRYYSLLGDLCQAIVAELRRLKDAGGGRGGGGGEDRKPPTKPLAPPPSTIFLAEASDDLEDPYDNVKRYLMQLGYAILPSCVYPTEPAAFEDAVRSDLQSADLFVQLLSEFPGKKLEGSDKRRVAAQHEIADQLGKPLLLWRRGGIDSAKVTNAAHRELLDRHEVMETDLEELKPAIVQRIKDLKTPPKPSAKAAPTTNGAGTPSDCFIFVNTTVEDGELAGWVDEELKKQSVWTALPVLSGDIAADADDFKANVKDCDGLLLVYGRSKPHWVRAQLRELRKMNAIRDRPLSVIGVYDGPPPKQGVDISAPGLRVFTGSERLHDFVEAVRQSRGRAPL